MHLFAARGGGVLMGADLRNPAQMPYGTIVLWYGTIATIPTGWALCNGASGTPDLRNKFVVCADADAGGVAKSTIAGAAAQLGGNTTHSQLQMAHGHDISYSDDTFDLTAGAVNVMTGITVPTDNAQPLIQDGTHIPPFFALAYIMKI